MVVLAVMILFGALYRISMALFFLGFTYNFLLDQAYHQNHYYLIVLISGLMVFLPAHGALSIDAWLRPKLHRYTVGAWMLWLLRVQLGIVYFYGGLAKLNSDWLHGEPVRTWIVYGNLTEFGLDISKETLVTLMSYGGGVYDLSIVPLLLWRRTRLIAYTFSLLFHLSNSILFSIGIFPWFMIVATAIFFDPDWPRFGRKLRLESKSPEGGFRWTPGRKAVIALVGL